MFFRGKIQKRFVRSRAPQEVGKPGSERVFIEQDDFAGIVRFRLGFTAEEEAGRGQGCGDGKANAIDKLALFALGHGKICDLVNELLPRGASEGAKGEVLDDFSHVGCLFLFSGRRQAIDKDPLIAFGVKIPTVIQSETRQFKAIDLNSDGAIPFSVVFGNDDELETMLASRQVEFLNEAAST